MNHRFSVRHSAAYRCILAGALWLATACCQAAEPARAFLDGLRQRGYYDLALDYLDNIQDSDLVPDRFKETILYERGVTLAESAPHKRDVAVQEAELGKALGTFKKFLAARGDHPLAVRAQRQIGDILVRRAGLLLSGADQPSGQAEKVDRRRQAGDLYKQARDVLGEAAGTLSTRLDTPQPLDPKKQVEERELRTSLRNDFVRIQSTRASILRDIASLAKAGSDEQKKLLKEAAGEFGAIYEKHLGSVAGLYARIQQGRCHQDMRDCDGALSYYNEVLERIKPDSQELRGLKTKTLNLAMQCWLDDSQKKNVVAILRGGSWYETAKRDEVRDPDWLELALHLAKAYHVQAATRPAKDRFKKDYTDRARRLARLAMQRPGPIRDEAGQLFAQLSADRLSGQKEPPKAANFKEARDTGNEAMRLLSASNSLREMLARRVAKRTNQKTLELLRAQIVEAEAAAEQQQNDAVKFYRLALRLSDNKTPVEEVNDVRFYLSYAFWSRRDYYDAAVMGTFLAKRYPDSPRAPKGAEIATKAYLMLYVENKTTDKEFEVNRIVDMAGYIIQQWPTSAEADEALVQLINFSVWEGKIDQAQAYLNKIPEDSPRRADAELKTGQALWSAYLRGVRQLGASQGGQLPNLSDPPRTDRARLEKIKQQAETALVAGLRRKRDTGRSSVALAGAAISLAQIYLEAGQPERAVILLEDAEFGTETLLKEDAGAVGKPVLVEEANRISLQAYIAVLPNQKTADDARDVMAKAESAMGRLKSILTGTPEGERRLAAVYDKLARDLQRQMRDSSAHAKQRLSKGLEAFLRPLAEGAGDVKSLYWVATTFFSLGESLDSGERGRSAAAIGYYKQAAVAYQKILDMAVSGKTKLSPQQVSQFRLQAAIAIRQAGQFVAARDMFEAILKNKNSQLRAQIEAAKTYQAWASAGKPDLYQRAIRGARPQKNSGVNTIWGWAKLAYITGRHRKYHSTFHQARYNLAVCQREYALRLLKNDQAKHVKYMKHAERAIVITEQLYPEMGGDQWRPRYDALLKKIQKDLNKKPVGLSPVGVSRRQAQKVGNS